MYKIVETVIGNMWVQIPPSVLNTIYMKTNIEKINQIIKLKQ